MQCDRFYKTVKRDVTSMRWLIRRFFQAARPREGAEQLSWSPRHPLSPFDMHSSSIALVLQNVFWSFHGCHVVAFMYGSFANAEWMRWSRVDTRVEPLIYARFVVTEDGLRTLPINPCIRKCWSPV